MSLDLEKLNKEQKEAVIHSAGPLLIVAGAGTGKTTVITQKIVYLIEKEFARPEDILAVTFTEKAAGEMEERVDKLLSIGYADLWISTFHAFCERVLRDFALDIGLPADFKILDQTSAWILMRRNLESLALDYYRPLGNPTKFIQALISHFSHCKDQGIYPEDYLEYSEKLKTSDTVPEAQEIERIKEVASAYHSYQRILLENNYLDFGDLINYCLKLFKERPNILQKFRQKFKYILVDEFQDTNFAQYELIKILAEPRNNLTVCADDDQSIYLWRSASFNNIIKFGKDFPKAKQVSLIRNYRSPQNILDLAYKFIKSNDPDRLEFVNKISKKLIAEGNCDGLIEHIHAKTLDEEVGLVIEKILEILKKDKTANFSDFAILVRANDSAIPFTRALERAGLPYQFLASRGLYSKPCILDAVSYFKLLDNYHESSAVYRILNLPFLGVLQEDIMKLLEYSRRRTKSLYEAMASSALISGISQKGQVKIAFILGMIQKHSNLAKTKGVCELLVMFLEDSGYLKHLAAGRQEAICKEQLDLLNQFYKKMKKFEETAVDSGLPAFIEEIKMEMDSGEQGKLEFDPEQGPEMIKVMTVHGAKGLEFKHVFLVNMVDKRFPTQGRKDLIELPEDLIKDIKPSGDVHLQEERRICYVAITRAKAGLYLTSAEDCGGARKKKLSQFLIEMGYEEKVKNEKVKIKNGILSEKPRNFGKKPSAVNYQLPKHFSFSQLAAFQKCPLQYKFNFILKVPCRGKAVFSFGKTMHGVLFQFLKQANEGIGKSQNNLFAGSSAISEKLMSFDDIVKIYDKNWVDEWYENKAQKEEYYKVGKKIIKDFFDEFSKNPPKILKLGDSLALEMPFNLKIGENTIKGQIDRIDGTLDNCKIVDYKTGNAKDKLEPEDKEQLLIYQTAVEEIFGAKPQELAYYYLNDGKKASFLGTEKDKENLKGKITQEIEEIKNSDFKATPGWQCAFCDFKNICDSTEKD